MPLNYERVAVSGWAVPGKNSWPIPLTYLLRHLVPRTMSAFIPSEGKADFGFRSFFFLLVSGSGIKGGGRLLVAE